MGWLGISLGLCQPRHSGGGTPTPTPSITAPVLTKTSSAGQQLAFTVTFDASYVGKFFHLKLAGASNFTTPLAGEGAIREVVQPIIAQDVITGPVFTILANQPAGLIYAELLIEDDSPATSDPSNVISTTVDAQAAAFTFTDVSGASLSTTYTSNTITISGLGVGNNNAYSVSGGTVSKNGGAFGASSGTVVDGDTLAVRATSSGSLSTAVNCALTVGTYSDTYTVTTAASIALATYRSSGAANGAFGTSATISSVPFYAGENVLAIMTKDATASPTITLGGTAGTKVAEIVTGTARIGFYQVTKGSGGTGNLVVSAASVYAVGYALWSMPAGATFVASQSLVYDYHPDPNETGSVTLPSGGAILVACNSESVGASITPETGTTEDAEFVDGSNWKFWAGQRAATGVPGVTGLNFAGSQMLAVSYQP